MCLLPCSSINAFVIGGASNIKHPISWFDSLCAIQKMTKNQNVRKTPQKLTFCQVFEANLKIRNFSQFFRIWISTGNVVNLCREEKESPKGSFFVCFCLKKTQKESKKRSHEEKISPYEGKISPFGIFFTKYVVLKTRF